MKIEQKQPVMQTALNKSFRPGRGSDRLVSAHIAGTNHFCDKAKAGFTLAEMLVVIVIIASLIGAAIPAINAIQSSYDSTGTLSMIEAALSSARATAISNRRYAGIRFQKAANPNATNVEDEPLKRNQYMILIMADEQMGTVKDEFRAVTGRKPAPLPENVGVMDMSNITNDASINTDTELTAETTFSIIFAPSGKLVLTDVLIRNKNGKTDNTSKDDVINTSAQIAAGYGMFVQDGAKERSRRKFRIYSRKDFKAYFTDKSPYSEYLSKLPVYRVNPHTGTIINKR